jgi:hypothetical protein
MVLENESQCSTIIGRPWYVAAVAHFMPPYSKEASQQSWVIAGYVPEIVADLLIR